MAVSLATGDTVWIPHLPHAWTDRTERMVDIDSACGWWGQRLCGGFQGRTAMLALDSGQIWWAHDMSSYRGLYVDDENLYVTQSTARCSRCGSGRLGNLDERPLEAAGVSTPVETSTAVVVGDYQGYLHWLDKATGTLVARERVAKFRISNSPVATGDTVVVLDDNGQLAAYLADSAHAAPRP